MIALSFGLALLTTAWLFYRITGGLFNPAVSLALWLVGALTSMRAILLTVAQILGGIIAAALVLALTPTGSGDVDAVNLSLSSGITYAQGFILEMLGTSVLVFAILMLAVEKHRATYLAPVGIGLTLFVLHLGLVAWTGCGVNPSRAFGPAVVGGRFPAHHEIYWLAPLCGAILSVIYFESLKALSYNSAVLNQDSDQEVVGLRPVHMRVFKRLTGDRHWQASRTERKRDFLRRRKQVKAETAEIKELNKIQTDILSAGDIGPMSASMSDEERAIGSPRFPEAALKKESSYPVGTGAHVGRTASPGSAQTLHNNGNQEAKVRDMALNPTH